MEESKDKVEKKISPLTTESVKGVSRIGTSSVGGGDMSTMDEALGQIFVILKRIDAFDKLQNKKQLVDLQISQLEETDRNQKLIKALRGKPRRPKRKPPEEEKQKQQIKEEKSKPQPSEPSKTTGQAPAPTTQPPKTTGQAPTTTQAPPKTTGQPATTTQAPPKTTGQPATQQQAPSTTTQAPAKTTGQAPATTTQPATTTTPVKPPPQLPTATKIPPVVLSGTKGLVLSALVAAGYSKSAQANMMANVEKESNFKPRSEEVPKPEKIFSMFGPPGVKGGQPENGKNTVRFKTLQDAQDLVAAGPEAYFNKVYDGRKDLGNTTPGDGYKYRGRGFIQITGRDMYNRVGKLIGEDLIGNPDLANTPEVAAKIIPAFFQLKLKEKKLNVEAYDNIDTVNKVVGSADEKSREQRKSLAAIYANELNTGNQIDQASTTNRNLKADANTQQPAPINVNNTYENTKTSPSSGGGGGSDDTNPYERKKNQ